MYFHFISIDSNIRKEGQANKSIKASLLIELSSL